MLLALMIFGLVTAYCLACSYVFFRILWYLNQMNTFDPEVPAFFLSAILPIGISALVFHSISYGHRGNREKGLPPRSVRNERKIAAQKSRIAELERKLDRELARELGQ